MFNPQDLNPGDSLVPWLQSLGDRIGPVCCCCRVSQERQVPKQSWVRHTVPASDCSGASRSVLSTSHYPYAYGQNACSASEGGPGACWATCFFTEDSEIFQWKIWRSSTFLLKHSLFILIQQRQWEILKGFVLAELGRSRVCVAVPGQLLRVPGAGPLR